MGFSREICWGQSSNGGTSPSAEAALEGEVHNLAELAAKLGISTPDNPSELVAIAYEKWGYGCACEFNGAFAFYVRDPVRRRLVIARDPAGRIPLYYRQTEGGLVFSTDLDEIERLSRSPGEIDVGSLNFYLALRHIPAPRTIFRDVCKVPAGHALVFDTHSGKLSEIDNRALPSSEVCCGDEVELVLELGELFQDAVGKRLRGGESPAVLLSGGLDSSLVAVLVSELSPEPVRTFTVGYMHRGYDERLYAKLVSDRLDTDHREVVVKPAENLLVKCVSELPEPLADPSIIPTYRVLSLVAEHSGTVISGDGADGLFLGLRTHGMSLRHLAAGRAVRGPVKYARRALAAAFPEDHKLRVFLEDLDSRNFFLRRNMVFTEKQRRKLFRKKVLEELGEDIDAPERYVSTLFDFHDGTFGARMGFFSYAREADDVMAKVHALSVPQGLRVRTPFLDPRLVEFALGKVPANLKRRGGVSKYLLKKLAERYLPAKLLLERKRGFNPPLSSWIRKDWKDFSAGILLDGSGRFFEREYVKRLVHLNRDPAYDQTRRLFALMVFRIWEMARE